MRLHPFLPQSSMTQLVTEAIKPNRTTMVAHVRGQSKLITSLVLYFTVFIGIIQCDQMSELKVSVSCPKRSHRSLYFKSNAFIVAQKIVKYLVYLFSKICSQELSKIAQSGHTGVIKHGPQVGFVCRCLLSYNNSCLIAQKIWNVMLLLILRSNLQIIPDLRRNVTPADATSVWRPTNAVKHS